MKSSPYNACDYRCERCLVTDDCDVFQTLKARSLTRDGIPDLEGNAANELADIRKSFRMTEDMIKQKAAELGINIDEIAGGATAAEIEAQRRKTVDDPLYGRCRRLSEGITGLLHATEHIQQGDAKEYFSDLAWHHAVICAKIYRALGWRTDDEIAIDARNSAAVAVNSLTICIMALEHLGSRFPEVSRQTTDLADEAAQAKSEIRTRFKLGSAS